MFLVSGLFCLSFPKKHLLNFAVPTQHLPGYLFGYQFQRAAVQPIGEETRLLEQLFLSIYFLENACHKRIMIKKSAAKHERASPFAFASVGSLLFFPAFPLPSFPRFFLVEKVCTARAIIAAEWKELLFHAEWAGNGRTYVRVTA